MAVLSQVVRPLFAEFPFISNCLATTTTTSDACTAFHHSVLSAFPPFAYFFSNENTNESDDTMTCHATISYLTTLFFCLVVLCVITTTVCAARANAFQLWPLQPRNNHNNKPSTTETSRNHPGDPMEQQEKEGTIKSVEDKKNDTKSSSYFVIPWWEDFFQEDDPIMMDDPVSTTTSNTTANNNKDDDHSKHAPYHDAPTQVLHFCFLVHGHRGYSRDLSYLQRKMQSLAEQEKQQRWDRMLQDPVAAASSPMIHDMIVHCAECNERKTTDGVQKGGERLVEEILDVIRTQLEKRQEHDQIQDITVSVVGNSLGGVYGRYAIAKLAQACETDTDDDDTCDVDGCLRLDGRYRVHFNIFCSTASPHLGISKHTYVPLPRSAEIGVARALGDTGRDLFRLNDLLKDMATSPAFLEPLRSFRKRVAYANAYYTDFPVPASTAAFLSDSSTYPHHFEDDVDVQRRQEDTSDNNRDPKVDPVLDSEEPDGRGGLVIATLHTQPSQRDAVLVAKNATASNNTSDENSNETSSSMEDDLVLMSASLDSLGWKKVFIDLRKEIPLRVSLPTSRKLKKSISNGLLAASSLGKDLGNVTALLFSSADADTDDNTNEGVQKSNGDGGSSSDEEEKSTLLSLAEQLATSAEKTSPIQQLRQKGVVESRDLVSAVSSPGDNRISFPIGHNLMIAMSRDRFSSWTHKKGRPVMDILAKELVSDIFAWDLEQDNELQTTTDLQARMRQTFNSFLQEQT